MKSTRNHVPVCSWVILLVFIFGCSVRGVADDASRRTSSHDIFVQRILPIFQSTKPSSCTECHLSGVELKQYIRPGAQETFVALRTAGMIDLSNPDNSKILRFIQREPEKPNLMTQKVRQQEFEAFRDWIRAAVADPDLMAARAKQEPIGPQLPIEVIRHARTDRILASFIENVWSEVGRCAACHSPDRNQKQVEEFGDQVSWIKLRDPGATLRHMLDAELIDVQNPAESLLLLKPTMQIEHGGGQKMVIGDRTYKQFRSFLDDYSAAARRQYFKAEQLPRPAREVSWVTDIWLKIEGVPSSYDKLLLQVDVYRWMGDKWSQDRVATSDRAVFGPMNLWQHSLSLIAPRGSEWAREIERERLPPGRYLAKVYVDRERRLSRDFRSELGQANLVAEIEVESSWPPGYGQMTVVHFPGHSGE